MVGYAFHVAVNLFQHQTVNRRILFLRKLKEAQEMLRVIKNLHEFVVMDGEPPVNGLKKAINQRRRPESFEASP